MHVPTTTAATWISLLDRLGFVPVTFELGPEEDWPRQLHEALPGLSGAALDQAMLELRQVRHGLSMTAVVEWTMWKNNEQRQHLRARLAPTEAPTEQQEHQGEVWHEPMSLTGLVEDMTEEIETRRANQSRLLTLESWLRSMPDAVVVVRAGASGEGIQHEAGRGLHQYNQLRWR